MKRGVALAALGAAGLAALPFLAEVRVRRAVQPQSGLWPEMAVEPCRGTRLGLSYRPLQAEALGLDGSVALAALLAEPFDVIRLGAYWDRIEPRAGAFETAALDRQVEAAERAGKQIVLCVGAVKAFGYPEFFVPAHQLPESLPEGSLISLTTHPDLLAAAVEFVSRVVERYRDCPAIIAWQVEQDAVDPLGLEHSWRLARDFVAAEVSATQRADGARPVLLNGFVATSRAVRWQQRWRTRGQGDSLAVAPELADVVGLDIYPRHALLGRGGLSVYLSGSPSRRALAGVASRRVMVTEGQAEPWEAVTTPPDPRSGTMYSCPPERMLENYNNCLRWSRRAGLELEAYLFWGAEYWLRRQRSGDPSYLKLFRRILEAARTSPGPGTPRTEPGD
ncbi:MAG: beta-galactosidase [Candidatus Dormibacteraeota bacterium]|nr:beta-galactosidase [Candidatus Dormibacteraeota bacterium]